MIPCVHCCGPLAFKWGDWRHTERGDSRGCHDGTGRTAVFCPTCMDRGWVERIAPDGREHLPPCPDCSARCIGRGSPGAGCGFRGLYAGAVCPDCGGMVLDGGALAEAAELAQRLQTMPNRAPEDHG